MAAVGTVLGVAQTLFAVLDSPVSKKIWSLMKSLGSESDLQDLKNTVSTVDAVLRDSELMHHLSNQALDYIDKLKAAVYDADDLFDEFKTIAERKQLLEGGDFSKEVRLFFSRFNQLGVAYNMSRGIKKIRNKLDAIARDRTQFGITPMSLEPIRRRSRETCSYVYEQHIIGRDVEKNAIIDSLLDPSVQMDVSFLSIVGIGGLGKTTLAQLVFCDEKIEKEFPLRLWACVADQDHKQFDIKGILCKILESATGNKHEGFELEVVQNKLREELQGRKYLLILDDIWNENRDKFLKLGEFLMCGGRGSRVVVTTRSMETGRAVGNGCIFELQGLTQDNSWRLFKRMAFNEDQEESDHDLIEIGKEIVGKCANVPLAIRMVGSLLYGQKKTTWLSFRNQGLASIGLGPGNEIIPILKLSYYHLDSCLKSCFTYCAVFPKDFVMEKEKLISLWIAQGYIRPLDEGQSLENAGEECFSILLRRCFFQDVKKDHYGEITSCKIHDLMHNIAQEAAGKEIYGANATSRKLDEKSRHLYNVDKECIGISLSKFKIRTYACHSLQNLPRMDVLLVNLKFLRALQLCHCSLQSLPSAIGELSHLRYLDVSYNQFLKKLPTEVTKIHNLQTLYVQGCGCLEELPRDLSKLRKLRALVLNDCYSLTSMPIGMDKLSCLCILSDFIVNGANSKDKQSVGKLEDIKSLTNLKGHLKIHIKRNIGHVKKDDGGGYMRNKEHLNEIRVKCSDFAEKVEDEEAMLENLQPHPNLKGLSLENYWGGVPSWASKDYMFRTCLPNLVRLELRNCKEWSYLPLLSKLQHLKYLKLWDLPKLVYMENSNVSNDEVFSKSGSKTAEFPFFPCLEQLLLYKLPELKGWWRPGDPEQINSSSSQQPFHLPSFPHLTELKINNCKNLMSFPLCPNLGTLKLVKFNKRLRIMEGGDQKVGTTTTGNSSSCFPSSDTGYSNQPKLRQLITDNVGNLLKSLPIEAFQCLSEMEIHKDDKLETLSEVREVFQSCSSSLRSISIEECSKLRSLCGALEHLTALESLYLLKLPNLINDNGEDSGIPWKSLNQILRSFHLVCFEDLVELPKGMQHLTSLQTLWIYGCWRIRALPEWISCLSSLQVLQLSECYGLTSLPDAIQNLTSLRELHICGCSEALKSRCQNPNGEDWPKIQHIPRIIISGCSIK